MPDVPRPSDRQGDVRLRISVLRGGVTVWHIKERRERKKKKDIQYRKICNGFMYCDGNLVLRELGGGSKEIRGKKYIHYSGEVRDRAIKGDAILKYRILHI